MAKASHQRLTIQAVSRLLRSAQVSSADLCRYSRSLARAGEQEWKLHAFAHLTELDCLLAQAEQSDARHKAGRPLSLLDGIPFAVKANLAVASTPLTAGSTILGHNNPNTPAVGYNADSVQALLDAGAICIGVTNMDEFGMGSLGTHTTHPTRNPVPFLQRLPRWDILQSVQMTDDEIFELHAAALQQHDDDAAAGYAAGGSSSGSAVSVAHGSSLLALGSDTGGSTRLPAAWCNVVGLKPSYGCISRHGLVSYASSLDCVGILTPSVLCAHTAWHEIVSRQAQHRDATLYMESNDSIPPALHAPDVKGLVVGIPSAFSVTECPAALRTAWQQRAEHLHTCGATIQVVDDHVISPDILSQSLSAYYVLASAEASSNLARYDGVRYGVAAAAAAMAAPSLHGNGSTTATMLETQYAATRTAGFGHEVARRVLCGTAVLSATHHANYQAATQLRAALTAQLQAALKECHALLVPASVFSPPPLRSEHNAAATTTSATTEMFANDVMTVPMSLAGLPSVSVPVRASSWPPMALQVVGRRFDEATILQVAAALDQSGL